MKPISLFTDIRFTKDPVPVESDRIDFTIVAISVAYNEKFKSRSGEWKEKVHFFNLEFTGHRADFLMKYGHKGAKINARCTPQQKRWTNSSGKSVSRISFRVLDFSFADVKRKESGPEVEEDAGGFDDSPF